MKKIIIVSEDSEAIYYNIIEGVNDDILYIKTDRVEGGYTTVKIKVLENENSFEQWLLEYDENEIDFSYNDLEYESLGEFLEYNEIEFAYDENNAKQGIFYHRGALLWLYRNGGSLDDAQKTYQDLGL